MPIVDSEARREMFLLIKLAEVQTVVASAMPTYFTSSFYKPKVCSNSSITTLFLEFRFTGLV